MKPPKVIQRYGLKFFLRLLDRVDSVELNRTYYHFSSVLLSILKPDARQWPTSRQMASMKRSSGHKWAAGGLRSACPRRRTGDKLSPIFLLSHLVAILRPAPIVGEGWTKKYALDDFQAAWPNY